MTQPAPFEVPANRREPTAAERFAGRGVEGKPQGDQGEQPEAPERVVPLRAVLDAASIILITVGLAVGVATAWIAGGRVPGLATLAGALIALGFLLNL